MEVWLVHMVAVYDHGVYYVAESEEDAERFTKEYAPDNDGHHNWEIRRMKVGEPPEIVTSETRQQEYEGRKIVEQGW